ncbi:hypothetical protein [Sphingomonas quercus]|uniref:Uncharacterized protein n=1 Tax=Sphingomonas quercus TaxID=2842451 RepID=A0ABS6BKK1_9SPHN|nr:hypothetical protein [Sphingomonas quercus]MBU3077755.1 hypothetical protein [Sphingomonas quercus]
MRFLIAAIALVSAGTALAAPVHTVRDGTHVFHYTATRNADGTVTLSGEEAFSRTPFAFTVTGARVSGTMDGQRVAFAVPRRTAQALQEQVGD